MYKKTYIEGNNTERKRSKLADNLEAAIQASGLKNGMTISFHHHFRSGDYVLNDVMATIAKMGYKDLKLAASSLATIHTPLIEYIKQGVITEIHTSGLRGELAQEISGGLMEKPVVIRSHGGRARAIEAGDIEIDVAFLGVPSADAYGNANGQSGKGICGSLGYAQVDALYAKHVVLITDCLKPYPNMPASINQKNVDQVVLVESIGEAEKIASGATRFTKNPKELLIAKNASEIIVHSPYFKDGFSFQTGSGGSSLAVTRFLREAMVAQNIKASFALGGITKPMVALHEEGLIEHLFDVQSFDLDAALSMKENPNHHEIDASLYANPHNKGAMTNQLNVVILSALEIDTHFNVNVITGSDGKFMGASGGHCDTAACADLTIVVAPLIRGRIPSIVDAVDTIVTPGSSVDVLVTERGIAINPRRDDLIACFKDSKLNIIPIEDLEKTARKIVGEKKRIQHGERVVGIIEYRDGSIIDVVKEVK
ncbi:MAG: citrate lyase subunit alpha [Clostridia bacterium]|nr:citrate lyase subunit alpha [Clostridia bacterium]